MDKKSVLLQDKDRNVIVPITTVDDVIVDKDTMLEGILPKKLDDYYIKYTAHYDGLGCVCGNTNFVAFITKTHQMPYYYIIEYFTNSPFIAHGTAVNDADAPGIYHKSIQVYTENSLPIAMVASDRYDRLYVLSVHPTRDTLEMRHIDLGNRTETRFILPDSCRNMGIFAKKYRDDSGEDNMRNCPHVFIDICPRAYNGRVRYYILGYGRDLYLASHNSRQNNFSMGFDNIGRNYLPLTGANGTQDYNSIYTYVASAVLDGLVIKENRRSTVLILIMKHDKLYLMRQVYNVVNNDLVLHNEVVEELFDINIIISSNLAGFPTLFYDDNAKMGYVSLGLVSEGGSYEESDYSSALIPVYDFKKDVVISNNIKKYKKFGNVFREYPHAPLDLVDICKGAHVNKYYNLDHEGYLRIGRTLDDILVPDYTTSDIFITNKRERCYFNKDYIRTGKLKFNRSCFMYKRGLHVFNIRNMHTGEDDTYLLFTESKPNPDTTYRNPLPSGVVVFTDRPQTPTSNILTTTATVHGSTMYSMQRDYEGVSRLIPREKYGNILYRTRIFHPLITPTSSVDIDFYGEDFTYAQTYGILPISIDHYGYISIFSIGDIRKPLKAILTFKYNNPTPNLNVLSGYKITLDEIDKNQNIIIKPVTENEPANLTISMKKRDVGIDYNNTDNTLSIKNKNTEIKFARDSVSITSLTIDGLSSSENEDLVLDESVQFKLDNGDIVSLGDFYRLFT